jgi:hypothetical protein
MLTDSRSPEPRCVQPCAQDGRRGVRFPDSQAEYHRFPIDPQTLEPR